MDRARKRFRDNLDKVVEVNPALEVLADQKWINNCTNNYIVHMARKMWLYDLTDEEIPGFSKAVTGYIDLLKRAAESTPVIPGNRTVKGVVMSARHSCRNHNVCDKHWSVNVRTEEQSTIYTPIPAELVDGIVGKDIEYFAYVTVSSRDETFGFAHAVKLLKIKEKSNAR